ncbi:MAG: hypothetical protein R2818_08960 [Flavobacteriales bacterium]
MANAALKTLLENAADFTEFARALELPGHEKLPKKPTDIAKLVKGFDKLSPTKRKDETGWLAYATYNKVIHKLRTEALEDFRIDFEDGFGNRSWEEEDATAVQAALEVSKGMKAKSLPPFIGIRIKPFTEDLKERGKRTLDIFSPRSPGNERQTARQLRGDASEGDASLLHHGAGATFEAIEANTKIAKGALKMEMMVETTQSGYRRGWHEPTA